MVLVGVLGSLLIALTAAGLLAASVLDWFLGEGSDPAAVRFAEAPWSLSFLIIAGAVWAYHRAVVRTEPVVIRSEVDRVHDYAAAGAGLVATVSGAAAVIAALVQVLTSAGITRYFDRSTLVNALALLLVGVPVWWRYWLMVQNHRAAEPETEVRSPTRRIHRFVMTATVFIPGLIVAGEFLNLNPPIGVSERGDVGVFGVVGSGGGWFVRVGEGSVGVRPVCRGVRPGL